MYLWYHKLLLLKLALKFMSPEIVQMSTFLNWLSICLHDNTKFYIFISVAHQNPRGSYPQHQNNTTHASLGNNVSGRGRSSKCQKGNISRKGGAYIS